MVGRAFVHVGLPKTATTYLQTILWSNRDVVARHGLLLPGRERRDHLWSSRVVREDDARKPRPEREHEAWRRVVADAAAWSGDVLLSHEFFAACSPRQAAEVVAALAPAEVHVLVTAREPLGLFTASWQESLKNRSTTPIEEYGTEESSSSQVIWDWRTLDLRLVLQRWSEAVPAERIHVLPLDPGAARDEIWQRFASVVAVPADAVDLGESFPNESMGVVEAELLRRVNEHLGSFHSAFDRGVYIRTFLADERLVPRGGERFWPTPAQVEQCRERGDRAVAYLAEHAFDVVGDADLLRVPAELPARRTPDTVSDAELVDAAAELIATLLADVRELREAGGAGSGGGATAASRGLPGRPRWRTRRSGR
ncbi:MAG: hypothetical protein F2667_02605 [Actinobacteria bacterium]|uniref:Unannotated protein n=1 Tax=freshwater metagenome TaxID=449393 RepID=A0A6J6P0K3_9ZZZZ|nr:hypothetical protein [Actinomycetota bacterium]